jgi:hypothetical protein
MKRSIFAYCKLLSTYKKKKTNGHFKTRIADRTSSVQLPSSVCSLAPILATSNSKTIIFLGSVKFQSSSFPIRLGRRHHPPLNNTASQSFNIMNIMLWMRGMPINLQQ